MLAAEARKVRADYVTGDRHVTLRQTSHEEAQSLETGATFGISS